MPTTPIPVIHRRERKPLHPDITEALIETLVREFYVRVRRDPELAPLFDEIITGDWEPHLQNMMRFWSSVLMMSGRYKGTPMEKHKALKHVRPENFVRWLDLFGETARDVCPPEVAALCMDRATNIAQSIKLGMFGYQLPPDQATSSKT